MTYVILAAVGLLFLFEGLLPFAAPKLWRRLVQSMAKQSDRALHITGFICLVIGVGLIYFAHQFSLH